MLPKKDFGCNLERKFGVCICVCSLQADREEASEEDLRGSVCVCVYGLQADREDASEEGFEGKCVCVCVVCR
jgi:ferredoxin-thioredoxin reductase catalytic subunit